MVPGSGQHPAGVYHILPPAVALRLPALHPRSRFQNAFAAPLLPGPHQAPASPWAWQLRQARARPVPPVWRMAAAGPPARVHSPQSLTRSAPRSQVLRALRLPEICWVVGARESHACVPVLVLGGTVLPRSPHARFPVSPFRPGAQQVCLWIPNPSGVSPDCLQLAPARCPARFCPNLTVPGRQPPAGGHVHRVFLDGSRSAWTRISAWHQQLRHRVWLGDAPSIWSQALSSYAWRVAG